MRNNMIYFLDTTGESAGYTEEGPYYKLPYETLVISGGPGVYAGTDPDWSRKFNDWYRQLPLHI